MSDVRIAIIGGGVIGRRHGGAIADAKGAVLVAVADPAPTGKELAGDLQVPLYGDIEALLAAESPDGVIISTPTAVHFPPAMTALEASCSALIEKPMMATVAEAEQILEREAASAGLVLVGHHRRYYALMRQARDIVQSGKLGKLVAVSGQWTARKNDDYYDPDWRKAWESGPILTNLIHEMDSLRFICGDIESISADVSHQVRKWEKEDAATILMRFASGALGAYVVSDQATSPWAWEFATGETPAFPKSGQNTVRFMGTEAALDFPNLTLWHHGENTPDWNHAIEPDAMSGALENAYVHQIEHFVEVIRGEAEPLISGADATETLRATLAVYDAAKSGQRQML